MEQESRGVLIISVPGPESQGSGKKQWEFLAGARDATLLPPEHVAQIDTTASGMQPQQQPGPRFWARSAGAVHNRVMTKKKLIFISVILALLVMSWMGATSFMGNERGKGRDDEDEAAVYPLVWNKRYGNQGEGTMRPEERATSKALLDRDAKRNAARALGLLDQANSSRPGRTLLSLQTPVMTNIGYPLRHKSPDGLYYIAMQIGREGKLYNLGIDTGAHLSWLLCDANCSGCPEAPHKWYKPESARLVARDDKRCLQVDADGGSVGGKQYPGCVYKLLYGDGSTTEGFLVQDVLTSKGKLVSPPNSWVTFGCSIHQTGLLARSPASEDGLLALSKSPVAMSRQLAPFFVNPIFGHCMSMAGGGYLFFGGSPAKNLVWTPYNSDTEASRLNYVVDLDSTYYGNSRLFPGFPVYVDSGADSNHLASEEYKTIVSLLRGQVPLQQAPGDNGYPVCWRGPSPFRSMADASRYFKPLKLSFKRNWADSGLMPPSMELPPHGYLKITKSGSVCLAFLESEILTTGPVKMIIGVVSLRGFLVVYDTQRNRLGWMPSSCMIPDGNSRVNQKESQRQVK